VLTRVAGGLGGERLRLGERGPHVVRSAGERPDRAVQIADGGSQRLAPLARALLGLLAARPFRRHLLLQRGDPLLIGLARLLELSQLLLQRLRAGERGVSASLERA